MIMKKKPLTVKQVDTITAALLRNRIPIGDFARHVGMTPAEVSLLLNRKKRVDQWEYDRLLEKISK